MNRLTEEQARSLLIKMNPELAEKQYPEDYHLIITGEYKKNAEGETTAKFVLKTNPDDTMRAAGVVSQPYFRVMVERVAKENKLGASGKTNYPYNVFESAQRNLFRDIRSEIKAGNFEKLPDTTDETPRPVIRLTTPWTGRVFLLSVPVYKLRDPAHPTGKFVPWRITRRDRLTGEPVKDIATRNIMPVVMDIDDLKSQVSVALNEFQNNVLPFVKGDIVAEMKVMGVTVDKDVQPATSTPENELPVEKETKEAVELTDEDLDNEI